MLIFLRFFIGCFTQLFPFAFLTLYPLKDCYKFSAGKTYTIILSMLTAIGIFFGIFCCSLYHSSIALNSKYLLVNGVFTLCLIPCLIVYVFLTKTSRQRKLFIFTFMMIIAFIMTYTNNIICSWVLRSHGTYDALPYRSYSLPILIAITGFFCPLLYIMIKKLYIPIADRIEPRGYGLMSMLSLFLFITLFCGLISINIGNMYNPLTLFLFIILVVSVALIYFILFRLLVITHDDLVNRTNLELLNSALEIQREQYKNISNSIDTVRKMKHDFKYDLLYIENSIKNNDSPAALSKIYEYISTIENTGLMRFSNDRTIDAVIGYYHHLGVSQGLRFSINAVNFDSHSIDPSDIAVLLGNLLDNAVTAAASSHVTEAFVSLNMALSGNMLAITTDNSYNGSLLKNGSEYLSTKSNHSGIGLKSILQIAHKYGGDAVFSHDNNVFHASVMLHLYPEA